MTNEPTTKDVEEIRGLLRHYGGMQFGAGRCDHLRDDEVIVSMEVLKPMQRAARDADKALADLERKDAALREAEFRAGWGHIANIVGDGYDVGAATDDLAKAAEGWILRGEPNPFGEEAQQVNEVEPRVVEVTDTQRPSLRALSQQPEEVDGG